MSDALLTSAPSSDADCLHFTVFQAEQPARLSKAFRLAEDGALIRESGGVLANGIAYRMRVASLAEFAHVLVQLTPGNAAAYGIAHFDIARVVPKRELQALAVTEGVIARTRDHFAWPEGPGLLMLDYDPAASETALSPEDWRAALYDVWPALESAPHLWRPSASSCILHAATGEVLRGITGQRLYVPVADARDIPRTGETLVARLWLAGHGRFEVSRSGTLLERTLIDASVWQPERLDFCGGAYCQPPLAQHLPPPQIFNGDGAPIDTVSTLANLHVEDKSRLVVIKATLRHDEALMTEVNIAQMRWVDVRLAEWEERDLNLDTDLAREHLVRAIENKRLMGDFPLQLDDGQWITVGQLLDQPDRYHNRRCADPIEPDYRGDRRIAWINLRNAGRAYVYSHAHGGCRYTLHRATRTLRLIGGELHEEVRQILELMQLDGTVFDRGGELVRVNDAGAVYPVTPEWLTVHLNALIRFERQDRRSQQWYAVDCPLDLAKRIIAMRGLYDLPRLRAVLTAPILTLDGRVLDRDGHDPATGLLLILNQPESLSLPLWPHAGQLDVAISGLWHPFQDFPFVGPTDRGVMLSALLTTAMRAVLPTAPGFLFTAPTAGSGKSLLAVCLSILVGADPAALMPPTLEEEELRKRLFAALREGRTALVFDNVVGHLDSAALCAFLTAREYSDRVLGSSLTLSIPATGLFLATGNNVALVGDLNRRLLTCRIDPQTDKPYRRAFALDPERYVRENRQTLVRHALVLIRGYLSSARRVVADRTASYEDWSDTVRQTVLWIGQQGWLDVADPCDAIDTSYDEDPETRKLAGLLNCWHALYGDKPKTVAEVIANATDSFATGEVSPDNERGLLQALLVEIAGEHGRINSRRLGRWTERMAGRLCEGLCFERGHRYHGILRWLVRPGGFVGIGGFATPYAREMAGDILIEGGAGITPIPTNPPRTCGVTPETGPCERLNQWLWGDAR